MAPPPAATDDWSSASFDFPPRATAPHPSSSSSSSSSGGNLLLSPRAGPSSTASKRASFDRGRYAATLGFEAGNGAGMGTGTSTAGAGATANGSSSRRGSMTVLSSSSSHSHLAAASSSSNHGRLPSLTSFCPPATHSPSPSPSRSDALPLPSLSFSNGLGLLGANAGPGSGLSRSPSPAPTNTSIGTTAGAGRRASLNSSTSSNGAGAGPSTSRTKPSALQLSAPPTTGADLFSSSPILGSSLTMSASPTLATSSAIPLPLRSPRVASPLLSTSDPSSLNGGNVSPGLGLMGGGSEVTPRRNGGWKGGFGWGMTSSAGPHPTSEPLVLDPLSTEPAPITTGGTGTSPPSASAEKRKLTVVIPDSPRSIRTKYRPHHHHHPPSNGLSVGGGGSRVRRTVRRLGEVVVWPVSALHVLLGPFAYLTVQLPGSEPDGNSGPSPAPNLASNPSSPALGGGNFKRRRAGGNGPPPLLFRLFGMAYVCISLVVFTRFCGDHLSGRSSASLLAAQEAEASKVRRAEEAKRQQVVFGGMGMGMGWVEGWEKKAREKLEGWMTATGGSGFLKSSGGGGAGSRPGETSEVEEEYTEEKSNVPEDWDMEGSVRRKWGQGALTAETNPLTPFSHGYRLAKMHGKLPPSFADEVEPYLFTAAGGAAALGKGEVTACMYTNDLWASEVGDFVKRWGGPVSLVWETTAPRTAAPTDEAAKKSRQDTIRRIAKLRDSDSTFRALVDVHLVSSPPTPEAIRKRRREKMLTEPVATNHQLNVARFFARSSIVWLVGDARITPSHNLRVKLNGEALKRQVLEHGDALVVPIFGFIRPDDAVKTYEELNSTAPATSFADQARKYVSSHRTSIGLPSDRWPKTKRSLVALTTRPQPAAPEGAAPPPPPTDPGPLLAMHDESWDAGKGPTNWVLWRKYATDPRLAEGPEVGGGAGIGVEGRIGGGSALYRVTAYDLHYAPNVVVSRQGQPWCTERFEDNKAACAYQMYLTGTELWVVPDEWAFTLKVLGSSPSTPTDAERLKNSISSRLYTKFHQEACMHYGREFLSIGGWTSDRARHLRAMCSKVLNSWGVGVSEEAAAEDA